MFSEEYLSGGDNILDFCFQKVHSFHNTMCHSLTQIFLMSVWFLWSSDPPLILLLKCTTICNPFKNLPLIVSKKCWTVKVLFLYFSHHFKKSYHALQQCTPISSEAISKVSCFYPHKSVLSNDQNSGCMLIW